ncbi:MAG: PilZ domain-containing protein [Bdellovibrionota bacterium]
MSSEADDFQLVTFETERRGFFETLVAMKSDCIVLFRDREPLLGFVKEEKNGRLIVSLKVRASLGISADSGCEALFSMVDGQYYLSATATELGPATLSLSMSGKLNKLQRRNNFRVVVPAAFVGSFTVNSGTIKQDLKLVDLSVGGARVQWPAKAMIKPKPGVNYQGHLRFAGQIIELSFSIRSTPTEGVDSVVGLEFSALHRDDERALLFLCLQLQRSQARIS